MCLNNIAALALYFYMMDISPVKFPGEEDRYSTVADKGLEVPCIYTFLAKPAIIMKLVKLFRHLFYSWYYDIKLTLEKQIQIFKQVFILW